jgi:alpha/beta superfamily hydrolase
MPDTNHFFEGKVPELTEICANHLDKRLKQDLKED